MVKEGFVMNGGERVFENGVKDDDESPCEHILEEMESFLVEMKSLRVSVDPMFTIEFDVCESESRNIFNQYKEISSLRQDLDSIFRTLSVFETGTLISHGSLEHTDDWSHNKRADHVHLKLSTDHSTASTLEENGKNEDSKISKPDNLDSGSLKDMSKDDLITYITKMRRNHESQVQEKTEENFRLRRELLNLKERGSSFSLKKDKDFDLLKKKIPDAISKLNEILDGNEKLRQFSENIESLCSFKDRLDFLQSENHQLKDMLTDKNKELKSLSSQLSVSMEKLLQQQLTEENLLRTVQKLEDDIGDAHVEVSVIQDVYKCFVEDIESECRFITEDLQLKYDFMEEIYEVMLNVTVDSAQASNGLEIEEANFESIMMQGLLDINQIIFKGALVGADEALKSEAAEKNKLKYEIFMLKSTVEEKENLLQGATDALEQEKRKMEAASEQFDSLRTKTDLQHQWMVENSKELDVTKGNLIAATKEIEQYKEQMQKLHRNLEQGVNELREVDKERRELCAVTKKQQDALKCIEAKERETRKQMDSTINLIHKLLTMVNDVEASVNEDISRNRMRLESMSSEFSFLKNKASALKTMGLVYKQRFETKSSDLAKAEAEEGMVEFIGMLKVKVIKGTDLAVRDIKSSDPYVVLNLGTQTVQTSVMKSNLNPVWNEEHMLSVPEHYGQLKLKVFDHDTFSADDIMGEADIDLQSLITSAMAFGDAGMFGDMQIGKWLKSDDNALIEDSAVKIIDGKVKQMMTLKLQNVESGEIELELEWISLDH